MGQQANEFQFHLTVEILRADMCAYETRSAVRRAVVNHLGDSRTIRNAGSVPWVPHSPLLKTIP